MSGIGDMAKLDDIFADLNARAEDLRLSLGRPDDGWATFADLAQDETVLRNALAKQGISTTGLDEKAQAAYLIQGLGYHLTSLMYALRTAGIDASGLAATDIGLQFEFYHWEEDEHSGDDYRMLFRIDPAPLKPRTDDAIEPMRVTVAAILEPIILSLFATTKLPKPALWRQAADGVVSGFLYTGRPLGCEPQAVAEGEVFLRTPGSPLTNKQSGFLTLTVTDDATGRTLTETFRQRGGCCRYYTCDDGEYCSTCVLRPTEERDEKLRNYMLERMATGAA
ncbi:MAG: (2Fe-2S)-binding protein [Devosia sp.]